MSEETKRKLSELQKKAYANGRMPWNKGKYFVFHTEQELKERARKWDRDWKRNNPEKCKASRDKWRCAHPDNQRNRYARDPEKYRKINRDKRLKNPSLYLEITKKWRDTHRQNLRATWFLSEYGISLAQLELMKNVQDNRCGICHTPFDTSNGVHHDNYPQVDHSHDTAKIRGILCQPCNHGIGYFKDNLDSLRRAIGYLLGQTTPVMSKTENSNIWFHSNNMNYFARWHLENTYGVTIEELNALEVKQGNKCAICGSLFDSRPHVDHGHITKKVRGLLCGPCNWGLGAFKDSIPIIQAAIRYLEAGGVPQIVPILVPNT